MALLLHICGSDGMMNHNKSFNSSYQWLGNVKGARISRKDMLPLFFTRVSSNNRELYKKVTKKVEALREPSLYYDVELQKFVPTTVYQFARVHDHKEVRIVVKLKRSQIHLLNNFLHS